MKTRTLSERRLSPEGVVAVILLTLALPMGIPTAQKIMGHNSGFLRDLGFLSGPPGTVLAWAMALITAILFITFAVRNIPPVARTWRQPSLLKLLALLAALAAATVEEAVFRRIVMDEVLQAGGGVALQIATSALAFGLAHAVWGLAKRSMTTAVRTAVATGVMGLLLAIVYILGDRSLAPCITAHFLITFALEPGLMLAAVSDQWRFTPTAAAVGNGEKV